MAVLIKPDGSETDVTLKPEYFGNGLRLADVCSLVDCSTGAYEEITLVNGCSIWFDGNAISGKPVNNKATALLSSRDGYTVCGNALVSEAGEIG